MFRLMTTGDFPPSSSMSGMRCSAAAFAMMLAMVPFPLYVTGVESSEYANRHSTGGLSPISACTVIPFQLEDMCDSGDPSIDDTIGR